MERKKKTIEQNMARVFEEFDDEGDTEAVFRCFLEKKRCLAKTKKGTRCSRTSFRHPYCLQHCQLLLGVKVGVSSIPNAGCGLFATVDFEKGDVILPYTGRKFASLDDVDSSVFTIQLENRRGIIDATCLRGMAAYANHSRNHGNACSSQFSLSSEHARSFTRTVEDVDSGIVRYIINPKLRTIGSRCVWKRIPVCLVRDFTDNEHYIWLVATKNIRAGEEILYNYGSQYSFDSVYHTIPPVCQ